MTTLSFFPGNVETSEAESMIQHIEDVFFSGSNPVCQPLFSSQHVTNRVVKLERGMSYFYPAEGLNPNDENSALVHYIQVILHYSKRWYGPVKCLNIWSINFVLFEFLTNFMTTAES
jgi:hypothetical protein